MTPTLTKNLKTLDSSLLSYICYSNFLFSLNIEYRLPFEYSTYNFIY